MKEYSPNFYSRPNGVVWPKIRFATNNDLALFYECRDNPGINWWLTENNCGCFPVTVQNSDDPKEIGIFLYTGNFTDYHQMCSIIKDIFAQKYPREEPKFGFKAKNNRNIKLDSKPPNFTMAANTPVTVECDETQIKKLQAILYEAYNRDGDRRTRIGYYHTRFMPNETYLRTGSSGTKIRAQNLRKHQDFVKNLTLITNKEIKQLDREMNINGTMWTLRKLMMETTYPLVTSKDNQEDPNQPRCLIHSIDQAPAGRDQANGTYYITAIDDARAETANNLLQILPAYVEYVLGAEAARNWFHADALSILGSVTFLSYEDGTWTGKWTTDDDETMQLFKDDDMGIIIEGLEQIGNNPLEPIAIDDLSYASYGNVINQRPSNSNKSDEAEASPTDNQATAAQRSGGGAE
jgi:hypothetical protein